MLENGLTAEEAEYLKTPLGQMTREQRQVAMAIRDKRDQHVWSENDEIRRAEKKR